MDVLRRTPSLYKLLHSETWATGSLQDRSFLSRHKVNSAGKLQGDVGIDHDCAMAVRMEQIIGPDFQSEDLHWTIERLDADEGMARAEGASQDLKSGVNSAEITHRTVGEDASGP